MAKKGNAASAEKVKEEKGPVSFEVTMDVPEEMVVEMSKDPDVVLVFPEDEKFRELTEETIRELPYEVRKRYFIALGIAKAHKRKEIVEPVARREIPASPLERYMHSREVGIPKRAGYHVTRIGAGPSYSQPANFLDACKAAGYQFVRRTKEGDPPEAAWEGSGDPLCINEGGDDYTYFMYAPDEITEKHNEAMALQSAARFTGVETIMEQVAEKANRNMKHHRGEGYVRSTVTHRPGASLVREHGIREEEIEPEEQEG